MEKNQMSIVEKRRIALKQSIIFVKLAVDEFKLMLSYKKGMRIGKYPCKSVIAATIKSILNRLCPFSISGTVVSKCIPNENKMLVGKAVNKLPDFDTMENDLLLTFFDVFRCHETLLVDLNSERNVTTGMMTKYNNLIHVMVKKIFNNLKYSNKDDLLKDIFLSACFERGNFIIQLMSLGLQNNYKDVGIVLKIDNGQRVFYNCSDVGDKTKHYRHLNRIELDKFYILEGDDSEKLETLTDKKYIKSEVDNIDYEYFLSDTRFEEFENLYKDRESFQAINIPDQVNFYITRSITQKVENKLVGNCIVVLKGMKGYGKTEIAIDVAKTFSQLMNVIWIDATSKQTIEKSFKNVYEIICKPSYNTNEESIMNFVEAVYNYFFNKTTLFVVDNAKNMESIIQYLPKSTQDKGWSFLITSYTDAWCHPSQQIDLIEVNKMEVREVESLLRNYITLIFQLDDKSENVPQIDNDVIDKLLRAIPLSPLAFRQSLGYIFKKYLIKKTSTNGSKAILMIEAILEFIENHEQQKKAFQVEGDEKVIAKKVMFTKGDSSVYATINLVMQELENELKQREELEAGTIKELLNIMTYFSSNSIPKTLLTIYCNQICSENGRNEQDTKQEFFYNAMTTLMSYLIVKEDDNSFFVEEMIQIVNRIRLENEGGDQNTVESILKKALECLILYMKENDFNNVAEHIISVWEHACKYGNIVKEYAIKDLIVCVKNQQKDNKGNTTFFHIIARYGDIEIMENVIEKIDINLLKDILNKRDNLHRTPLHSAAEGGNLKTVKKIFELNPNAIDDVNKHYERHDDSKRWNPLQLALKSGNEDVVKYLLENGHEKVGITSHGFTLLHLAALNGYSNLEEFINEDNSNVNKITKHDFTPLHMACKKGYLHNVKLLLDRGANIKAVTQFGKTPLHLATDSGFDHIVCELLEEDSKNKVMKITKMKDKDKMKQDNFTPAHMAVLKNRLSTLKLLIEKDKTVLNEESSQGNTLLHLGSSLGHLDIVKFLLEKDVKLDILNKFGETALDLAKSDEMKDILKGHNSSLLNKMLQCIMIK